MEQLIKDLIEYREKNELSKKTMVKLLCELGKDKKDKVGYSAYRLWEDGIQTPCARNVEKIKRLIY